MEKSLPEHMRLSLKGAWELVRLNPRGMNYFDVSSNGFWRSFWAIAVGAPVYFLWLYVKVKYPEAGMPAVPVASYVVSYFLALPFSAFVMLYFTRFMKLDANYIPMVIAYNWVSVVVYAFWVPVDIFFTSGVVGAEVRLLVSFIMGSYLKIVVVWFLFRQSLKITVALAIGVVLFNWFLNVAFEAVLWTVLNPEYLEAIKAGPQ